MIIDFSTQDILTYDTDLCIIGGGIAAYTLLSSLAHTSMRILVVERGGMKPGPEQESDKACEITGHSFTGHLEGRYFGLGGTSEYWGGQALPLQGFDLTEKGWVSFSGWPINIQDLMPYFPEAEKLMQVDPVAYETDVFDLRSLEPLSWNQSQIELHFSKWSPRPNFKNNLIEMYSSHPSIHILINAATNAIEYDFQKKEVTQIRIQHLRTKQGTITAKNFVLASGGIENARLLLVSESLPPNQWIGRMFQDHPTAQVATIQPTDMQSFQRYFNYFFKGRTRCLPRLSLSHAIQEQKRVLAATAFIQFIAPEGSVFDSFKQIYRFVSRLKLPSRIAIIKLLVSLRKTGDVFPISKAYLLGRYIYVPRSTPRLTIMLEQVPSPDSYIGLSSSLDSNGIPLPIIHWQISDATIDTLKVFCSMLELEFSRLNLGNINWDAWLSKDNETIRHHLIDAYHHMGTTRMSHSDTSGVVDSNCRMHEVKNLYIAGSSVFPTSGHSNPTLTLMALTLRLGRHLASLFKA